MKWLGILCGTEEMRWSFYGRVYSFMVNVPRVAVLPLGSLFSVFQTWKSTTSWSYGNLNAIIQFYQTFRIWTFVFRRYFIFQKWFKLNSLSRFELTYHDYGNTARFSFFTTRYQNNHCLGNFLSLGTVN